jgi:hypothetical protein
LELPTTRIVVRRAVLLVVRVQREEDVERLLDRGVRPVLRLGHLEHHVQEVAGVAEVVVRVDDRQAAAMTVRIGGERRDLRDEAPIWMRRLVVTDVLRLRVERREGADGREQDAHRVRVVAEAVDELPHVLVNHGVHRDLVPKPSSCLLFGSSPFCSSHTTSRTSSCLLGELLDRVSAVLEDALVAVDERDLRARRRGVLERRVVRHQAEVVVAHLDLPEIHRLDGPVADGTSYVLPVRLSVMVSVSFAMVSPRIGRASHPSGGPRQDCRGCGMPHRVDRVGGF